MSLTDLALLVNLAMVLVLTGVGWRNRSNPGARWFVVLQLAVAGWIGTTLVGLNLPAGRLRVSLWGLAVALSLVVAVLWLGFILAYTGNRQWLRPIRLGPIGVPLLAGAVVYAVAPAWPPLVGAVTQSSGPMGTLVAAEIGPVGAALGMYLYALFLGGVVVVVRQLFESNSLFLGQEIALVIGSLVPVVASAARIFGLVPAPGYPLTQVSMGAQSLLWGYAVFRQAFLGHVPAVARHGEHTIIEGLDDGLLVVDTWDVVVRANPEARTIFGDDPLIGRSIGDVLPEVDFETLPARFQRQGRTYQVKCSPVTGFGNGTVGQSLVIRDVTQLVHRQQRLQVLNRILRHNVGNDLTVVLAWADELQGSEDPQAQAIGRRIVDKAEDLVTISKKARDVEQMLDTAAEIEVISLGPLVEEVTATVAEQYPDAVVEVTVTADQLRTNRALVTTMLTELVENALQHNTGTPHLTVEASERESAVELAVRDDGPGIPPHELDPLQSGEETPLEHTSSLGLWLVHWGAQALGGRVDVDSTTDGSTVTVTLPLLEEDEQSVATPAVE
jgi:signal transduction histidine kinase